MPAPAPQPAITRGRLIAAFAALYVFWGATYLAIRVAVETLPPFLMAGVRFVLAGALVLLWLRLRGALPRFTAAHWRNSAVVGTLLLLGGNGGVVWAEQRVPSGLASLLVSVSPLWFVLLDWLWRRGAPPRRVQVVGLVLGFAGVVVLQWPTRGAAPGQLDLVGASVLLLASLSWSFGSIWGKGVALPESPLAATALQMLTGGAALLVVAVCAGELHRFDAAAVSARSLLGFGYLIVFGSLAGFSAYVVVLKHAPAAQAATYAYVNPVIAVALGWAILREPVTPRVLLAAAVIVVGVALVVWRRR